MCCAGEIELPEAVNNGLIQPHRLEEVNQLGPEIGELCYFYHLTNRKSWKVDQETDLCTLVPASRRLGIPIA